MSRRRRVSYRALKREVERDDARPAPVLLGIECDSRGMKLL